MGKISKRRLEEYKEATQLHRHETAMMFAQWVAYVAAMGGLLHRVAAQPALTTGFLGVAGSIGLVLTGVFCVVHNRTAHHQKLAWERACALENEAILDFEIYRGRAPGSKRTSKICSALRNRFRQLRGWISGEKAKTTEKGTQRGGAAPRSPRRICVPLSLILTFFSSLRKAPSLLGNEFACLWETIYHAHVAIRFVFLAGALLSVALLFCAFTGTLQDSVPCGCHAHACVGMPQCK